jgi:Holliday junction resolvase-like predicted endonuclease
LRFSSGSKAIASWRGATQPRSGRSTLVALKGKRLAFVEVKRRKTAAAAA